MIPNFALALSFEGISLLRRMGPKWARLDEVSLDHADFDSAVIALRDLAESLDPTGAQVALLIPNEQIRYLDQPDLGGDEISRDVAIRASLDGATPYDVSELDWDHVVSGGRLMVAAVAKETLEEARSFAVEHGFDPVCYLAQAPEGAFDGAVFFGKAKSWSRAASRPGRAIEIVAANKAALKPIAKPEQEDPRTAPEPEPSTDPAAKDVAEHQPAGEPASVTPPEDKPKPEAPAAEAPEPEVAAPQPSPAPAAPVEAPKAEVPPKPVPAAQPEPPAPKPAAASAEPAQDAPTNNPAPLPETPVAPAAPAASPKSPVEAAIAAHKAPAPDVSAPAQTAAPASLAFSSRRAASAAPSSAAPTLGPALSEELKPRFTPLARDASVSLDDDADKPAERSGFFARPSASALLAEAAAAADAAEGKAPAPKTAKTPAPAAVEPPRKPQAAAAPKVKAPSQALPDPAKTKPLTAEGPKFPPKTRKAPGKAKRSLSLPPQLSGKAGAKPGVKTGVKPGVKSIPKSPSRAAALAAVPAAPPDMDEMAASPVAARRALEQPKPKAKSAGGTNPLAKLAALRGPRAALPAGGQVAAAGAAALPAGGPAFNTSEERDRMTIFGARDRDEVGGKPRFLGLILVTLLLLFLAGVAAWASVFLDDKLASLFRGGGSSTPAPVVASLPTSDAPEPTQDPGGSDGVILETASPAAGAGGGLAVTLGKNADDVTGEGPDASARPDPEVQIAAFDAKDDQLDNAILPLAVPLAPRTLSPEEAAASYAATGIWQRSPGAPMTPPEDGVEDIYVASIDPNIQIFDAVALPDAARLAPGLPLADPGLPPPSDLTFDFDDRDLIRATPEGALTPDGLRIFTGRPPVIPPLRGDTGSAAPPQTGGPQADDTRLAALAAIRPAARPADVIEQRERVQLGGISRAELARFRPVMRPQTVQERAEIDTPDATAQAVKTSLVPVGRPRNMAAIVEQADKRPAPQPVQTAAVAPRTVQPKLPSSASVARSATLENAINLNRINLIGVYGTPDNRRALVRLPNGKYEKVKIGDRLDGGRVSAIGDDDLRYNKNGRNVVLKMPRG